MSRMLTRVVIAVIVTATLVSTTRSQAGVEVLTANQRVLVIAAVGGQIGIVQTRTLAMVHAAIHDALNTVDPRYRRYAYQVHRWQARRLRPPLPLPCTMCSQA